MSVSCVAFPGMVPLTRAEANPGSSLLDGQLSAGATETGGAAGAAGRSTSRRLNCCCSKTKLTTACSQTVATESHQTWSRWNFGCDDTQIASGTNTASRVPELNIAGIVLPRPWNMPE